MGKIKNILCARSAYFFVFLCIIVFLICFICFNAGRESAERDNELRRVRSTQQQLDDTAKQLNEAVAENRAARKLVTDSIVINERLDASLDRSSSAVARSEAANKRTGSAVSEAQSIIADAKRTAEQDAKLISNSKLIIERAVQRNKRTAVKAEK